MTSLPARRVFLMGLRGSGKTRLGTALAARMSVPFFDADGEFRARTGRLPAQVLRDEGEEAFRGMESEVLLTALETLPDAWVLALGGGSLGAPGVFARLARGRRDDEWTGVWLRAPATVLARRIEADGGESARPRLLSGSLESELEGLARTREPRFARLTDLVVDTSESSIDALVLELEARLAEKSRN